jgi:hypothetical protein
MIIHHTLKPSNEFGRKISFKQSNEVAVMSDNGFYLKKFYLPTRKKIPDLSKGMRSKLMLLLRNFARRRTLDSQ